MKNLSVIVPSDRANIVRSHLVGGVAAVVAATATGAGGLVVHLVRFVEEVLLWICG